MTNSNVPRSGEEKVGSPTVSTTFPTKNVFLGTVTRESVIYTFALSWILVTFVGILAGAFSSNPWLVSISMFFFCELRDFACGGQNQEQRCRERVRAKVMVSRFFPDYTNTFKLSNTFLELRIVHNCYFCSLSLQLTFNLKIVCSTGCFFVL